MRNNERCQMLTQSFLAELARGLNEFDANLMMRGLCYCSRPVGPRFIKIGWSTPSQA